MLSYSRREESSNSTVRRPVFLTLGLLSFKRATHEASLALPCVPGRIPDAWARPVPVLRARREASVTRAEALAALDAVIAGTAGPELPDLIGALARALATAWARFQQHPEAPARLLTPEEAAELACVPVRRLRSWARGKRWALHPSKRTLRIEEKGFREWLDVHNGSRPVAIATETPRRGPTLRPLATVGARSRAGVR